MTTAFIQIRKESDAGAESSLVHYKRPTIKHTSSLLHFVIVKKRKHILAAKTKSFGTHKGCQGKDFSTRKSRKTPLSSQNRPTSVTYFRRRGLAH